MADRGLIESISSVEKISQGSHPEDTDYKVLLWQNWQFPHPDVKCWLIKIKTYFLLQVQSIIFLYGSFLTVHFYRTPLSLEELQL